MAFRFAYRLPCPAAGAKEHSSSVRLRRAWSGSLEDWMTQDEPGRGCLAVFPAVGGSVGPEHFGPPRACSDGLTYFPSKTEPSGEDLIRPQRSRPPGNWLTLHDGGSLYVPLALATPRRLLVRPSGFERSTYATELGILGHDIYDQLTNKKQPLDESDPRFLRLIQLTLQAGYHVTEEMIEDGLPFGLTDQDINPMLLTMFGADPKSWGAEPVPSPSAPVPTPTSP